VGKYSINLATNDIFGTYLVNQTGFTLYYFMNDAPANGISNCNGKCAEIWPPFYAETLTVPDGLKAENFASQLRGDGKEQTAYKGWPLYFYYKDIEPKDAYGQGFNKVWSVVNPGSSQFKQSGSSGFHSGRILIQEIHFLGNTSQLAGYGIKDRRIKHRKWTI